MPSDDAVHGPGRRHGHRGCGVLARCLAEDDFEPAFRRFEAHRKPRTSRIQSISSANTWLRQHEPDTSWLYGYDAWEVDLDDPAPAAAA